MRALVGFLVAPAVPAVLVYLLSLLLSTQGEATWSFGVFAAVGYLATAIIGAPVYFLLQRRHVRALRPYLILGAGIGFVCIVLGFVPYAVFGDWASNHEQAVTLLKTGAAIAVPAMISGAIASAVFWLIAIKQVGSQ